MNPLTLALVGAVVVVVCAVIAYLLVRGARNARIANEIYDGTTGSEPPYDPNEPLVLAKDEQGHPVFAKWAASDQEGCRACGQTWDRNDSYPPQCEPATVQQCANCGMRWRLGQAIPRHCTRGEPK